MKGGKNEVCHVTIKLRHDKDMIRLFPTAPNKEARKGLFLYVIVWFDRKDMARKVCCVTEAAIRTFTGCFHFENSLELSGRQGAIQVQGRPRVTWAPIPGCGARWPYSACEGTHQGASPDA